LRTFQVNIETTARLRPLVPTGVTLVAESGIHTSRDVARLREIGVHAMLVGESLVVAKDTGAKMRELLNGCRGRALQSPKSASGDTSHTRIKICGITTLDDALAAVEAGVDMLGFNFYEPSPRYVRPPDCARMVAALQDRGAFVTTVGVFVNTPPEQVAAILDDCGLDLAQLSGDEPPEFLDMLGRAFKSIHPPTLDTAQSDARRYARRAAPPALLVDAYHPSKYGGTGQTGDWTLARTLAAEYPLLLAGGLRPENVARAIAQVQPWGVDVASGVEASPGKKDAGKMAAFVQEVRNS
jgi:phosphoribosylanthranilate isomerase